MHTVERQLQHVLKKLWQMVQPSCSDSASQDNNKSGLGEWLPGLRANHRKEIILARFRIGQSYYALLSSQRRLVE